MNAIRSLLINMGRVLAGAGEVVRYALVFLWAVFCPKAVLVARLLAAESQIAACKQQIASKKRPRPRFTPGFQLPWVVLSRCLDRWEDLAHLMQPATVKKWHTRAFRHFWRWKSGRAGGRPPISRQMQSLTYPLSKENPLWSPERIHDTLVPLEYDPPCADTIRKSMYRLRRPRKRSTTWPGPIKVCMVTRPFLMQSRQTSQALTHSFPFLCWEVCITGMSASPRGPPKDFRHSSQRFRRPPRLAVKKRPIESLGTTRIRQPTAYLVALGLTLPPG